jgi:hypothetical protein
VGDNLKFFAGLILLGIVIVLLGWKEPLRYRFMSSQDIYELEHPAPPPIPSTPQPGDWMRESGRRTMLDRGSSSERTFPYDGLRRQSVER